MQPAATSFAPFWAIKANYFYDQTAANK